MKRSLDVGRALLTIREATPPAPSKRLMAPRVIIRSILRHILSLRERWFCSGRLKQYMEQKSFKEKLATKESDATSIYAMLHEMATSVY